MPAPIIVVHDEVETRELAVSALRAAGFQAAGFDDPMKALAVVEADTRVRVPVNRQRSGPPIELTIKAAMGFLGSFVWKGATWHSV